MQLIDVALTAGSAWGIVAVAAVGVLALPWSEGDLRESSRAFSELASSVASLAVGALRQLQQLGAKTVSPETNNAQVA